MRSQLQIKTWKASALPANWNNRTQTLDETLQENVEAIVKKVAENGDAALIEFTKKFDKATLKAENLQVTRKEIKEAYSKVSQKQIAALKLMKNKVASFEKLVMAQFKLKTAKDGIAIQNVLRPIESVGCYVPGGQAAYPSTVVMTAVPAKITGVSRVVVCSPPTPEGKVNPLVLVAADICEVNEIYKAGGAQAIAALAYGTETIKPVKKIVGPGNKYVTAAKMCVNTRSQPPTVSPRWNRSTCDRHKGSRGQRNPRSDITFNRGVPADVDDVRQLGRHPLLRHRPARHVAHRPQRARWQPMESDAAAGSAHARREPIGRVRRLRCRQSPCCTAGCTGS